MISAAQRAAPRVGGLVLLAPSPRFLDDPATGYRGGFTREDIETLLESLRSDQVGWATALAPVLVGDHGGAEPTRSMTERLCRLDPVVAVDFAEVTFLSDCRDDLAGTAVPTVVVQCADDPLAPVAVGEHVHRQISGSELVVLPVAGHCPHLTAPRETAAVIADLVGRR